MINLECSMKFQHKMDYRTPQLLWNFLPFNYFNKINEISGLTTVMYHTIQRLKATYLYTDKEKW